MKENPLQHGKLYHEPAATPTPTNIFLVFYEKGEWVLMSWPLSEHPEDEYLDIRHLTNTKRYKIYEGVLSKEFE